MRQSAERGPSSKLTGVSKARVTRAGKSQFDGRLRVPFRLAVFVAVFVGLIIWILTLPKEYVFLGARTKSRWADLRIWAVVSLIIQIVLYLLL